MCFPAINDLLLNNQSGGQQIILFRKLNWTYSSNDFKIFVLLFSLFFNSDELLWKKLIGEWKARM